MPFSSGIGKDTTIAWFAANEKHIKRVLDIGVGSGTYAKLIKSKRNITPTAEWVGIEAWTPYIEKFQLNKFYNSIINCDIRKLNWGELGQFDVAIAGDILEHMTKEEAVLLVENILTYCSTLIISIPISFCPQDEYEGNPFEIHVKPDWSHDEVIETWKEYVQDYFTDSSGSLKLGVYWLSKK